MARPRVPDRQYNPGLRDFYHDMNKHRTASYHHPSGYDYVIEAQHGYVKVWQAVSDDPENRENRFEWDKVAERYLGHEKEAKRVAARIGLSVNKIREFVDEWAIG